MNFIFHNIISYFMEVYINNVVVKFMVIPDHLRYLIMAFEWIRKYKVKINPLKCAFKV